MSRVKLGALTTCVFHGKNRARSPEDIINYGVVLTTYATLAADHKDQAVLKQIQWCRIVLDEGKLAVHSRIVISPRT